MAEDSLKALGRRLRSGDFQAVFMHRETDVPAEVAEAVVEHGLPVHLAGSQGEGSNRTGRTTGMADF